MDGEALNSIDLTTSQYKLVTDLLRHHLPNTEVWAYGSRVKFTSRPNSDLDMVAFTEPEQKMNVIYLKEAFEESNLPFTVDFFTWDDVPEKFHENMKHKHFVLQQKNSKALNMPSGWKIDTIGSVADVNMDTYTPSENWEHVSYLDTGNITEGSIDRIQDFHKGDILPHRARRKVLAGDIVYSTVRPNQKHYGIISDPHPNMLVSTGFAVLRGKEQQCDTKYLYYFLTQPDIVEYLQAIAEHSTSTYPAIKPSDIASLKVVLPKISEQRAIAHILGTLDDKIELNRQMNQTLEATARALFKSWFIDFDPVHTRLGNSKTTQTLPKDILALFPDSFEDSEIGKIPKGWEVKSLDQIADYLNGLACQKYPPESDGEALPVIKIRELRQGITEATNQATPDVPAKYIIEDGDILFSWSGSLLITMWTQGKGVLNQHLFKVTSKDYPKWFYYYWTDHHLTEFQHIAADKATTMGHIKRHHLKDAKCCVPDGAIIEQADRQIAPVLNSILNNDLNTRNLTGIRDALLSNLISGELRVPNTREFLRKQYHD